MVYFDCNDLYENYSSGTTFSYTPGTNIYLYDIEDGDYYYYASPSSITIPNNTSTLTVYVYKESIETGHAINKTMYFKATQYIITTSVGTGGSISPSSASVLPGGSTSFTITANTNYTINQLKLDNIVCSAASGRTSYT